MTAQAPDEGPSAGAIGAAAGARAGEGKGEEARSFPAEAWKRLRRGELGLVPALVGLAVICAYFQIKQPTFLSARNLSNLVLQIGVIGTLAVGIVLVLLLSEIDLSVGSVSILCSAVLANLLVNHGWSWYWALAVMLIVGGAIGVFQGFWSAVVGVPSFVVTLAGLLGWQGVQQYVLGATGTINVFESHIGAIATTTLPDSWGWALAIGASAIYALVRAQEQLRRRRAGLAAQPLATVAA
ncbi:MAG: ABC transporter permease, partial [Thermoleophilia bacterium]